MDDDDQTRKDTSYSPASERETAKKQDDTEGLEHVPPGTGGPDDSGDLDVATGDLHLPNRGDPE